MALQSSGAISLNEIHVEAGGNTGTQASINDSDIRGLIGKSSGTQMSFNEWYGASSSVTMTSAAQINSQDNQKEQSASSWVSAGETLIIPSNFWVWSDNTSVAALTIDVSNITVQNNGFIIGRGGDGGSGDSVDGGDGGPAIKINSGVTGVTITNGSGAYIAGGGGGGASGASGDAYAGGGGGAGGGSGGDGAGSDIKQSVSIGSAPSGGEINAYGDNVEDYDDGGAIGNTNHPNPPISGVVDAGAGGQGGHTNYDDVGLGGGSGGRKLGSDAVAGYGPALHGILLVVIPTPLLAADQAAAITMLDRLVALVLLVKVMPQGEEEDGERQVAAITKVLQLLVALVAQQLMIVAKHIL